MDPSALAAERGPGLPAPPELSEGFPYHVAKSSARGWPGYSGKVSEAWLEKGEKILALATNRIADLLRRWLADPEAPGAW